MNKSALRNFAVNARRDLIKIISDRANLLGVYENKPESQIQAETDKGFVINGITYNYPKQMRDDFIKRVKQVGYQDAIEEIAYTWFNRIVALRFMEVNGYLKNGKNGEVIYIIGSTTAGKSEPDAVTYADKLSFVDKEIVYKYQDENKTNELYRYILTSQCNELNKVMPLMFEKIDNYVELLLPDHLIDDNDSVIAHLVNDIDARDFNITVKDENGENASQVEIIGWLYQFYISEKKDEVFASKDKINKGTLPAVTQLFTPDWIVRYMVENSLGKMWVDGHKTSNLKKCMKYYVEEAEQTEEVKKKLDEINKEYARKNVKEITFIDPCCGSGHILVYAFEIFYKMYQESGYLPSEIPALILKNNLFGIDVDKRAAQLTSFALTMKALNYDKDFLKRQVYPNVIDIKESNLIDMQELKDFISLAKLNTQDEEIVLDLIEKFKDAELYGSLIKDFKYTPEQYDILLKVVENIDDVQFNIVDALIVKNVKQILIDLIKQAMILSSQYDIVVTNPPYMKYDKMNDKLRKFVDDKFYNERYDLYSSFIYRCKYFLKVDALLGMITMHHFLYTSSFLEMRKEIINWNYINFLHLGARAFEEINGEVVQTISFIIRNSIVKNYSSVIINVKNYPNSNEKEKYFNNKNNYVIQNIDFFNNVPNLIFAYQLNGKLKKIYLKNKFLLDYIDTRAGVVTGDDELFIRFWYEINNRDIELTPKIENKYKYVPFSKGGTFTKWYGNVHNVLRYDYFLDDNKTNKSIRRGDSNCYFKRCIGWSQMAGGAHKNFSELNNCICKTTTPTLYVKNSIYYNYILALLNTKIVPQILSYFNPTLSILISDIENIPISSCETNDKIDNLVNENIKMQKLNCSYLEQEYGYEKNPLI